MKTLVVFYSLEGNTKLVANMIANVRLEFWKVLLNELAKNNSFTLFNNISSSKDSWVGAGAGVSGISYNFAFGKNSARVELYMSNEKTEFNKIIFDKLYAKQESIETALGKAVVWERLDEKRPAE